jgi:hypothetical protein
MVNSRIVIIHYVFILLFVSIIIGCSRKKNVLIDFMNVEMACNANTSDYGNVLFQLQIDNQTNSKVQLVCDSFPNDAYAGFYILSYKLKSGAIKLQAAETFKTNIIEKAKKKTIWLSLSIAAFNNQFKYEYQNHEQLKSIKDFLYSTDYKIIYIPDSINLSQELVYKNFTAPKFAVLCSENQKR